DPGELDGRRPGLRGRPDQARPRRIRRHRGDDPMTDRPPDVPGRAEPPDPDLALQVIADLLEDVGERLTAPELKVRALTVLTIVHRLQDNLGEPLHGRE